jgi:hypothetical protein
MELENIVLIIIFSILLLAVICMVGSHLCNETTNIQVHVVSPNEANNKNSERDLTVKVLTLA